MVALIYSQLIQLCTILIPVENTTFINVTQIRAHFSRHYIKE